MADRRKYELKKRAESQAETRRRITEATVALHARVGPAATQVAEIARLAGVQRMTVYRHFPEEAQLLEACRDHWLVNAPPPDPAPWAEIADPAERARCALRELYGYYAGNAALLEKVLRDAPAIPALNEIVVSGFGQYLREAARLLASGWRTRGAARRRLGAVAAMSMRFETWHMLTRDEGFSTDEAADLMASLIDCTAGRPYRQSARRKRARRARSASR